jgi:hypothetical protein
MSQETASEAVDESKHSAQVAKFEPSGDPEVDWYRSTYRGNERQFTVRSFMMGTVLGALMALSNLRRAQDGLGPRCRHHRVHPVVCSLFNAREAPAVHLRQKSHDA